MMAENPDQFERYRKALRSSEDIQSIQFTLDEIVAAMSEGTLGLLDGYDLRAIAFAAFRELAATNLPAAEPLILGVLLPSCLASRPKEPWQLAADIDRYRTILVEWMDEFDEVERGALQQKVLDALVPLVLGNSPESAIFTAARLDVYRTDLAEALSSLITEQQGELGAIALAVLAAIEPSDAGREGLRVESLRRLDRGLNRFVQSALRSLVHPGIVDHLDHYFARADERVFLIELLSDVADAHSDDALLQDRIWGLVLRLVAEDPVPLTNYLLRSGVGIEINNDAVVPTLLRYWPEPGSGEARLHRCDDIGRRLRACTRPRQVASWQGAGDGSILDALRYDAQADTGFEGRGRTLQSLAKEAAWQVCLCLGFEETLDWFDAAIITETNSLTKRTIMLLLACFQLNRSPDLVLRWVREPFVLSNREQPLEWAPRMASIALAHSIADDDAFKALLRCGIILGAPDEPNSQALRDATVAVVDLAVRRTRAGADHSAELIEVARDGTPAQKDGAAAALARLAELGLLPEHALLTIEGLLDQLEGSPYGRAQIVAVLVQISGGLPSQRLLQQCRHWAATADDWVGLAAFLVLGTDLEELSRSGLLEQRLGLQLHNHQWVLAANARLSAWQVGALANLYRQHPDQFVGAVAAAILQPDPFAVSPLIVGLSRPQPGMQGDKPPNLPKPIAEAICHRLLEHGLRTPWYNESYLLDALAHLAPDILAATNWTPALDGWSTDMREALATALVQAELQQPDAIAQAMVTLQVLLGDEGYAVRRGAYRALSRMAPSVLNDLCQLWGGAVGLTYRLTAAEMSSWLASTDETIYAVIRQRAMRDSDPLVRKAAKRAAAERRQRRWAYAALMRVLNVTGSSNIESLSAWPFGQVVAQLGDDDCLDQLARRAADELPQHVRHWLGMIAEELEKTWKKHREDWPTRGRAWPLTTSSGTSRMDFGDGDIVETKYILWKHQSGRGEGLSEGGVLWPCPAQQPGLLQNAMGENMTITVTGIFGDVAIFRRH
jgi:hypothetical protein